MDAFRRHIMNKFGLVEKAAQAPAPRPQKPTAADEAQSERQRIKGIPSLQGEPAQLKWLAYATSVSIEDAKAILAKDDTEQPKSPEFDFVAWAKARVRH